jgi:hypothetical protein
MSIFKMCKNLIFDETTKDCDGFLTHHFINNEEKITIQLEKSFGSSIFVKKDGKLIYSPFNHYLCDNFNIFQVFYIHIILRFIKLKSKKKQKGFFTPLEKALYDDFFKNNIKLK